VWLTPCLWQAYRYGSDYIITNAYDEEALKMKTPVSISILGFVSRASIPFAALIDSGYAIAGGESLRAQTAISSLAQAMDSMSQVAIARFVKTQDADPLIGILIPMDESGKGSSALTTMSMQDISSENVGPHKLVWIQMPFEEDFAKFTFQPFGAQETTGMQRKAAENLVDSMMLDDDDLARVANPGIRSLNRTLIRRLVKGESGFGEDDIVDCRANGDVVIEVPPRILESCKEALADFHKAVPVKHHSMESRFASKRYWSDATEEGEGEPPMKK